MDGEFTSLTCFKLLANLNIWNFQQISNKDTVMLNSLEVSTVIESLNACAIFAQQAIETYRDIELPDLEANLLKKGIMRSCFDIQDCIRVAINPRTSQADLVRICEKIEELVCIWQSSEYSLKIRLEKLSLL